MTEEQFIIISLLKYGTLWEAYTHYKEVNDHYGISVLRNHLKMEDAA